MDVDPDLAVPSAANVADSGAARQLRALFWLAQRLADAASRNVLADALDMLVGATPATAAAALSAQLEPIEETGFGPTPLADSPQLRAALRSVALQSFEKGRPILIDNAASVPRCAEAMAALAGLGGGAALGVPIECEQAVLGVFVLVMPPHAVVDRDSMGFVTAVADIVGLALRPPEASVDRRAADAARQRAARAEAGMLSATLAQELRGLVDALTLQLEEQRELLAHLALLESSSDSAAGGVVAQLIELTEDIDAAVAHLQTTTALLSSVDDTEGELEDLDLGLLADEALAIALPLLEQQGAVVTSQFAPDCLIRGRRDHLAQVILKLLAHAGASCASSACPPAVSIRVQSEDNGVVLIVTDTGVTIPEELAHRWFEPFGPHATFEADVGLRLCADVVATHGGHVELAHTGNTGNAIRVVLPRLAASPRPAPGALRTGHLAGVVRRREILVVDDDPVFVRTVRRALKPHDVRTATTASEAEIALFDSSYSPDLVLCDVFLPGANGDVMHSRVTNARPELGSRFVFITGGAVTKAQAETIQRSGCPTLLKPVDFKEIVTMLNGMSD